MALASLGAQLPTQRLKDFTRDIPDRPDAVSEPARSEQPLRNWEEELDNTWQQVSPARSEAGAHDCSSATQGLLKAGRFPRR